MNQTISILGCGWLGLPLGKHLVEMGHNIKGSTTDESKLDILKSSGISPYLLNFNPQPEEVVSDFFDCEILIVNIPPRNKNGQNGFHQQQLESIYSLAKGKVSRLLFISSTAVYPAENKEVTEADATSYALSRDGISLLNIEQIFTSSAMFRTTVLRFGGLYGPNRHPGRFLAGKQNITGAHNPVNMIHLDDCIGVIDTIINKNIWGEVFNAVAPSDESRQSFYCKAAAEMNLIPPTFNDIHASYKKVNSEKLKQFTGYVFKH